jgi:L-rhamnose mutarotase
MERICFTLRVRRDCIDAYRDRHASVWPEMREALREAGWTNYSIFLRPSGLAIGYVETPDFSESLERMDGLDVNRRWQAEMSDLVAAPAGKRVDQALELVPSIFYLP